MTALTAEPKAQIDAFRQEFLAELPALAREYVDTARAEQTTAAYEKVMNTALKVIEGLAVQEKKDPYANLPVIHVSFGPGMQMATVVEAPAAQEPETAPGVIDVQVKALPDDVLDLLPTPDAAAPTEEEAAVLATLDLAASLMALD